MNNNNNSVDYKFEELFREPTTTLSKKSLPITMSTPTPTRTCFPTSNSSPNLIRTAGTPLPTRISTPPVTSPSRLIEHVKQIALESSVCILPLELLNNKKDSSCSSKDLLNLDDIPDFSFFNNKEEENVPIKNNMFEDIFRSPVADIIPLFLIDDGKPVTPRTNFNLTTITEEGKHISNENKGRFSVTEIVMVEDPPIQRRKISLSSSSIIESYIPFKDIYQVISILDWDNSLFPTMGYTQMISTTGGAHIDDKFQTVVKKILQIAISLGKVFIITNAKKQWIDICVNEYMPCLKSLMPSIDVISACDENITEFPDNPGVWKKNTFINHLNDLTFNSKNILCLNDEKIEQTIFKDIMKSTESLQNINLKLINITKTSSIIELYKQLELVLNCYEAISRYDGFLDFDVGIKNV
jgi:hypothetical protein